jgi:hypothetical protein
MGQRTQYAIKHVVQSLAEVLAEKPEHEIPMLLESGIFVPVAAVSCANC